MAGENILIIEDDTDISELVKFNLSKEHYRVECAYSGEAALKAIKAQTFDLCLLDLMLPGVDGLDVCRTLKKDPSTAAIPIIMVTAKGEEADIVLGIELGAEDYMVKPFSPKVLMAKVRAVFRRKSLPEITTGRPINIYEMTIHPGRHEVVVRGEIIDLTYTEFQLLYHLASRPRWVFTRYQIVNAINGENYAVTDRAVDVQVANLRKKLGEYGKFIETVRGIGYRFSDKASTDEE
jgi:two-component system, OmpR family, alkaline phosphatase synthesis response regulator PhoP